MNDAIASLGDERFAASEQAGREILWMGRDALPWLRAIPVSDNPEIRIRLRQIESLLSTEELWKNEDLLRVATHVWAGGAADGLGSAIEEGGGDRGGAIRLNSGFRGASRAGRAGRAVGGDAGGDGAGASPKVAAQRSVGILPARWRKRAGRPRSVIPASLHLSEMRPEGAICERRGFGRRPGACAGEAIE